MELQGKVDAHEINLLELLQVLVKRKMFVLKACALAIIASAVYSLTMPNIYAATARVLLPQKEGSGGLSALLGQAGGLAGLAASGIGGGNELYLSILKSRSVNDAVIRRLDLIKHYDSKGLEPARDTLSVAVKMQAGKDGIISITAEDKDPKVSALLANTFVDELGKTTVRLNLSKAGTERLFLEKRLELVKKDLKKAEDDLKAFAQQNKIVQVETQAKASIESLARMKAELADREVQLSVLRSAQTEQSAEVKALASGIQRLRSEISRISGNGSSTEGIPTVGDVPGVGVEYSRKLRELKAQEVMFEQLTKQYEVAKLTEAKDSSSFQVIDEAVVPTKRVKPKRSLLVLVATISTFCVSVFWIYLQYCVQRMSDADKETWSRLKKETFELG